MDSLKNDVVKAEREVSNSKKEICEKEKDILTLQIQCDDLDEQINSARNKQEQDLFLISHLEEKKRKLKMTLRQIKATLDDDKAKLNESLENSLRIEAELRMKMETKEVKLKTILRHEAELRKQMNTNESELKKQIKQMVDKIMDLQERLRQFENENYSELQSGNMNSNGQKENSERADINGKVLYLRHCGLYVLAKI